MLPRLLSSAVGLPLLLAAIWLGGPTYLGLVLLAAAVALLEFFSYLIPGAGWPLTLLGVTLGLLLVVNAHLQGAYTGPLLAIMVVVSLTGLLVIPRQDGALALWGGVVGGALYVGWLLGYFVSLRALSEGRQWVLLTVLSTFAVDSSAYLVGRVVGRHRMAPSISPGKTWEGAAGGVAGGLVAAGLLNSLLGLGLLAGEAVLLGGLVAIFAQVGDLAESLLKRSAGVKDAGWLLPGHGGVLDRLDSLLFSGVVVYYYVLWMVG